MEALVDEPASVEWLRTQLPHGWMIVSPEVVSAMRNMLAELSPIPGRERWADSDAAVIESALGEVQ